MALATVMLMACGFMAWRIAANWRLVDWSALHFNPAQLLLATAIYFLAWETLCGINLKILYGEFGQRMSWWNAVLVTAATRIAKYVPGGVWFATAKALVAERFAIPKKVTFTSMVVDLMLLLSASGALATWVFIRAPIVAGFVAIACVVVMPGIVLVGMRVARRIFGDKLLAVRPHYGRLLLLSALYLGILLIETIATYLLINSFYPIGLAALPHLAAAWSVSWIVGFLVPFAPGGIGIRDALFATMLTPVMPVAVGGIAAIVSRVWILVCEVIAASGAWAVLRTDRQGDAAS